MRPFGPYRRIAGQPGQKPFPGPAEDRDAPAPHEAAPPQEGEDYARAAIKHALQRHGKFPYSR